MRRLRRLGLACATVAAQVPGLADAAQWYVAPRLSQDLGYDDNIELDSRDQESAVTSVTGLGVAAGGRTPTLDLRLDAALAYTAYLGGGPGNSDSETIGASVSRRATPRTGYGLSASFVRDTSIDDVLDDTGQQRRTNDERYTFGLTPFLSHELTQLDTLNATSSWRRREDTGETGTDFTTLSGQIGWLRTISPRLRLGGNLYANRYESDVQASDLVSPRLSARYSGSEVLDFDLSLGPSVSRTETKRDNQDQDAGSETQFGFTADGTASLRLGPVTRAALTLSHYLEPSGDTGDVSRTSRVALSLAHRLSQRLAADAGLLAQRQERVQRDTGDNRDFFQASAGVRYALTERLDLGLRYRLRHEREDGGDATSNAAFVTLVWRLQEYRTSW
jgi:opacity protein-like surface antigen